MRPKAIPGDIIKIINAVHFGQDGYNNGDVLKVKERYGNEFVITEEGYFVQDKEYVIANLINHSQRELDRKFLQRIADDLSRTGGKSEEELKETMYTARQMINKYLYGNVTREDIRDIED